MHANKQSSVIHTREATEMAMEGCGRQRAILQQPEKYDQVST